MKQKNAGVAESAKGGQVGRFSRLWRPRTITATNHKAKRMIVLYIIKSTVKNFRYIGITNNLLNRIKRHNDGRNKSTKRYRPFKLLVCENFINYKEARKKEVFLKSGAGRKLLDSLKLNNAAVAE